MIQNVKRSAIHEQRFCILPVNEYYWPCHGTKIVDVIDNGGVTGNGAGAGEENGR